MNFKHRMILTHRRCCNTHLILSHNMFGKFPIACFQALVCEWFEPQTRRVIASRLLRIAHKKCYVIETQKFSTAWLWWRMTKVEHIEMETVWKYWIKLNGNGNRYSLLLETKINEKFMIIIAKVLKCWCWILNNKEECLTFGPLSVYVVWKWKI